MSEPQAAPLALSAEDVRALALALAPAFRAAGLAVVPVEPTRRMINRGFEHADIDWRAASEDGALCDDEVIRIYRAMLAAAQEAG